MPIYFDKKRQSYRWEFRRIINGREIKRRKRLVPGISRVEAEKFARDEEARIFKIAAGIERPEELIADALAEYLSKRKFKDSTIPEGIALMLPYIEGKTISQFPDVVKEYQDDNPQHSPATQRNRIGYIRAGLRWCWRHQVITAQVPPVVIPNPNNQRHNYLLLSEQQKLLDCIVDVEAKALFTLTFWTGCRWEMEILTLSRESIITNGEDVFIDIGVTKMGEGNGSTSEKRLGGVCLLSPGTTLALGTIEDLMQREIKLALVDTESMICAIVWLRKSSVMEGLCLTWEPY